MRWNSRANRQSFKTAHRKEKGKLMKPAKLIELLQSLPPEVEVTEDPDGGPRIDVHREEEFLGWINFEKETFTPYDDSHEVLIEGDREMPSDKDDGFAFEPCN